MAFYLMSHAHGTTDIIVTTPNLLDYDGVHCLRLTKMSPNQ